MMEVGEGKINGDIVECTKGGQCSKDETNVGSEFASRGDIVKSSSTGASEEVQTYKRRRLERSSLDSRSQEDGRANGECLSQMVDQLKEPVGMVIRNSFFEQVHRRMSSSDDSSVRHWRNAVLEHMYQSVSDDAGGVHVCIREAIEHFQEIDHTLPKESVNHNIDRFKHRLPAQSVLNGPHKVANGQDNVISNGSSSKSKRHTVTATCQQAFFNILVSEKFASLCKLLMQNFQGFKADRIFDLKVINSRMKSGAYEDAPSLFSMDMQQVWRKLQGVGMELSSLAESLSDMSTSCKEQVGVSVYKALEVGKNELHALESDSHTKLETEDCGVSRECTCRHCGNKANGSCLVCDSCEDMYHLSCIMPAVKGIPTNSWYCASCTAKDIESPHENCVVCERLVARKTLVNGVGGENCPSNEETVNDLGDNSYCSTDDGLQQYDEDIHLNLCKMCGAVVEKDEKVKRCGHPYCTNKYYHVRCLTPGQLKLYGPRWYCSSCLCRACLTDKDDENIVLCDGCDHAYHIYCMNPPLGSVPEGKWFCTKCDAAIQMICRARRAYEKIEKQPDKKGEGSKKCKEKVDDGESKQGRGGMDVLLHAVKTLDHEKDMAATEIVRSFQDRQNL